MLRYAVAAAIISFAGFGCGDDGSSADGGTSASSAGTVSGTGSGTAGSSDDAGTDTGPPPPPPPSCDGIGPAVDDLGTTPGAAILPFPTMEHLSIVWEIAGDTNEDSVVTVRYRPVGGQWREGTPLRRIPAGAIENLPQWTWANKHAGSLFGLEPGTTYEVELFVSDPDGGCEVQTMEATTRTVPQAMAGAPVIPVTPANFAGAAAAAGPGDVLELATGTYPGFTVAVDGAPGAPVVFRAVGDVTVTGDIRIDGRQHVIVEGLSVQGQIKFNGGSEIAVIGCTIAAQQDGIAMLTRGENAYIADNTITGVTQWTEPALGAQGNNVGEGIVVTGPGHVIEHNRVTGFRDAISFLEDGEAVDQFSLDVLRNDIYEAADDGVEADFCFHNCRVVENRLTNTFIALSSQPGLGGPTYFVRNSMYSVILSAFKLQRGSVGDVVWHNTVVKNGDAFGIYTGDVFSRQMIRNNIFIGGPGGQFNGFSSGSGDVINLRAADPTLDMNYDGFGSTTGSFSGQIGMVQFSSLAELQSMTTEVNAVELDLGVFAGSVPYPASPIPALPVTDLRLANNGAAIDAGVRIPGINDGAAGAGPDLGAHEAGDELPAYGPR